MDIAPGIYNTGTATVETGGLVVSFQGTPDMKAMVREGDRFGGHVGLPIRIASRGVDTVTLAYPWPGPAQTAAPYEIGFTPYDLGYRQSLEIFIERYGSTAVAALAELALTADTLPYGNGNGTMALTPLPEISRELLANFPLFPSDIVLGEAPGRILDLYRIAENNRAGCYTGVDGSIVFFSGVGFSQDRLRLTAGGQLEINHPVAGWISVLPERGANANGSFTRFPDGTLKCWRYSDTHSINSPAGSMFVNGAAFGPFPWPATFVGEPSQQVTAVKLDGSPGHALATAVNRPSETVTSSLQMFRTTSSADQFFVMIEATGRWF